MEEAARKMESHFCQFFDHVIVNDELQDSCVQLLTAVRKAQDEPQWVPASWIRPTTESWGRTEEKTRGEDWCNPPNRPSPFFCFELLCQQILETEKLNIEIIFSVQHCIFKGSRAGKKKSEYFDLGVCDVLDLVLKSSSNPQRRDEAGLVPKEIPVSLSSFCLSFKC